MIPDGQPESEAGQRPRRDLPRTSRKVLITASALTVVAVGAYAVGTMAINHPEKTTIATSGLSLPTLLGLPTYVSQSASPAATHSAAPTHKAKSETAAKDEVNAPVVTSPTTAAPKTTPPTTAPATPSGPIPVGAWALNQTSGIVAVDDTGNHDGAATDITWSDSAAVFNGSSSQITASGPLVDASAGDGFTISAWVDMASFPVAPLYDETAVSEDTGTDSPFYLQYTEPADRWAFSAVATNTINPDTAYRATSTTVPELSTWTHLVGVYDGATGQLSLYVNGQLQGTATDPTPFAATGDLAIGRGQYDGNPTDWFSGRIKEVQVFSEALSATEVSEVS